MMLVGHQHFCKLLHSKNDCCGFFTFYSTTLRDKGNDLACTLAQTLRPFKLKPNALPTKLRVNKRLVLLEHGGTEPCIKILHFPPFPYSSLLNKGCKLYLSISQTRILFLMRFLSEIQHYHFT